MLYLENPFVTSLDSLAGGDLLLLHGNLGHHYEIACTTWVSQTDSLSFYYRCVILKGGGSGDQRGDLTATAHNYSGDYGCQM